LIADTQEKSTTGCGEKFGYGEEVPEPNEEQFFKGTVLKTEDDIGEHPQTTSGAYWCTKSTKEQFIVCHGESFEYYEGGTSGPSEELTATIYSRTCLFPEL
jgi:hypothetical protein